MNLRDIEALGAAKRRYSTAKETVGHFDSLGVVIGIDVARTKGDITSPVKIGYHTGSSSSGWAGSVWNDSLSLWMSQAFKAWQHDQLKIARDELVALGVDMSDEK